MPNTKKVFEKIFFRFTSIVPVVWKSEKLLFSAVNHHITSSASGIKIHSAAGPHRSWITASTYKWTFRSSIAFIAFVVSHVIRKIHCSNIICTFSVHKDRKRHGTRWNIAKSSITVHNYINAVKPEGKRCMLHDSLRRAAKKKSFISGIKSEIWHKACLEWVDQLTKWRQKNGTGQLLKMDPKGMLWWHLVVSL